MNILTRQPDLSHIFTPLKEYEGQELYKIELRGRMELYNEKSTATRYYFSAILFFLNSLSWLPYPYRLC
jgi:hypothetical protein